MPQRGKFDANPETREIFNREYQHRNNIEPFQKSAVSGVERFNRLQREGQDIQYNESDNKTVEIQAGAITGMTGFHDLQETSANSMYV